MIIDDYVDKYEAEQPLEAVVKVANKILKQKRSSSKKKRKLTQSLMQKGYSFEKIKELWKKWIFSA